MILASWKMMNIITMKKQMIHLRLITQNCLKCLFVIVEYSHSCHGCHHRDLSQDHQWIQRGLLTTSSLKISYILGERSKIKSPKYIASNCMEDYHAMFIASSECLHTFTNSYHQLVIPIKVWCRNSGHNKMCVKVNCSSVWF